MSTLSEVDSPGPKPLGNLHKPGCVFDYPKCAELGKQRQLIKATPLPKWYAQTVFGPMMAIRTLLASFTGKCVRSGP